MFPYTMDDVLFLLNITYGNSQNIRTVCPVCRKKDFTVNRKNEKFSCFHCNLQGRGGTQLYSYIYSLDNKAAYKEIVEKLNLNVTDERPIQREIIEEDNNIAQIEKRNAAYSSMIDILSLNERDKKDLTARGFLDAELVSLEYRSAVPKDDSRIFEIPKQLIAKGCTLEGVPGFFVSKNEKYWMMKAGKSGILIPYRDYYKRIQGFQLRKHKEELDMDENKYSWFSSTGMHKGVMCKAWVHYACDFKFENNDFSPILPFDFVVLTEGAMKADLFHCITGMPTIAVPGVASLAELDNELPRLKERGIKKILIAYDMDYQRNEHVQKAIKNLKNKITSMEMTWQTILWNEEVNGKQKLKGIDDYYAFKKRGIVPM